MANLGIEIKRKCPICGKIFIIKTLDSVYCSPKCSKVANKREKDKEKKEALFVTYAQNVPDIREYLTVRQVVAIYGVERSTLYRLAKLGKNPCIKVGLRDKTDKLNNVNRDLDILKSAYNSKLEIFNAVKEKDKEVVNFLNHHASIIVKASILEQVLYDAAKICRELPDAEAMAEDTFIDDRNYLRWEDVLNTGIHVFIAGLNGATSMAPSSGGGGTSNDMPWRDKDEDLLDWARRAMRYAHAKHYPGNRLKRTQNR